MQWAVGSKRSIFNLARYKNQKKKCYIEIVFQRLSVQCGQYSIFRRQDEKRYEEMRARCRAIHAEERAAQEKISQILSEQMERQKDFLHWAAGKNSQLSDRNRF